MKQLSHTDYCTYFAKKCTVCKGEKRLRIEGTWVLCQCQQIATLKYRFEQFDVYPPELKYKTWTDFRGYTDNGEQRLTAESFVEAKAKAFAYCFGKGHKPAEYEHILQNRKDYLIVHENLSNPTNVIIVGNKNSGRTLVAALIIKEVAHACMLHRLNISFKYIKANNLLDAARWDNVRPANHALLDEMADTDFLVIDDIDVQSQRGHHTNPPDALHMSKIFVQRVDSPTILICSEQFWAQASSSRFADSVAEQWGKDFLSILLNKQNVLIELRKESA